MRESHAETEGRCAARFPTTRWSLIVLAGRRDPTGECEDALASLCARYWYALYAFARRLGYQAEDAEDLTQGFFEKLLQKNWETLKAAKDAMRRVREMTYANAEDYLIRVQEALNWHDKSDGRHAGMKQFLDDKSYKPGLGPYDKFKSVK